MRGGSCPTNAPARGRGTVSAIAREKRALVGIEHTPRVEFDGDAKHVVVEKQILELPHASYRSIQARINGSERKPAKMRKVPSGVDAPFSSLVMN